MPITITTTVGGATSNSYVSVSDADTYFESRLNTSAWTGDDDKKKALVMAAKRLQDEQWRGSRVDDTQALAWPRYDVEKYDNAGSGYGSYPTYYDTDEIPQPVKDAQCELALFYLQNTAAEDEANQAIVEEAAFDSNAVRVKYANAGQSRAQSGQLPLRVARLLQGLVRGNRLVRA